MVIVTHTAFMNNDLVIFKGRLIEVSDELIFEDLPEYLPVLINWEGDINATPEELEPQVRDEYPELFI